MEWRLSKSVIRGELDNTRKGQITGRLWLVGRDEPLELTLTGNCLRDIAGQIIHFDNPAPGAGDDVNLATQQDGTAGECTASRRFYYTDDEKDADLSTISYPLNTRVGNCLYLEWYNPANGFVVVEGPDFHVTVSEPAWEMTMEEEDLQIEQNEEAFASWMNLDEDETTGEMFQADDRPLNEFEWEQNLKEMDSLTDRFSKILEKYVDHPDAERRIAREMGWTWLMDALDAQERGDPVREPEESSLQSALPKGESYELTPNPLTEGVDWIRGENGRIMHPLTARAFSFAMEMWGYCRERNLLGEKADPDLQDMIFQAQMLSAKLAGALDCLAYDEDVDCGFVVACLKRTLAFINRSMADADSVERKHLLPMTQLQAFRKNMMEIREEILRLMTSYRKRSGA